MQDHRPITLYREDGTEVIARNYYSSPTRQLASGLISEDGRLIRCADSERGLFWFAETEEKLTLTKPE